MQKYSFTAFACLVFLFTACKKETLLETTPTPTSATNISKEQTLLPAPAEVTTAALDEEDSISVAALLLKPNKNINVDAASACFGPITGICGTETVYSSCYYKYQLWNDPNNLYVDLYFPSSVIGWRKDCNGGYCQYYVVPRVALDIYNAAGTRIGSVNLTSSNITVTESRITFNLNTLKASYPDLSCVSLSGLFYVMKKCGSCSATRVSSICITPKQFCVQQCPSACPSVTSVALDKSKLCGGGAVNGAVVISGDASKATTTWTVDGQVYTGNNISLNFPSNTDCAVKVKTVHVKVVCTTDQSVLKETDLSVVVNPLLSAEVQVDNYYCQATIDVPCATDGTSINWTLGNDSGTGSIVTLDSNPRTLNYTVVSNGCSVSGTMDEVYCLPLLRHNTEAGK